VRKTLVLIAASAAMALSAGMVLAAESKAAEVVQYKQHEQVSSVELRAPVARQAVPAIDYAVVADRVEQGDYLGAAVAMLAGLGGLGMCLGVRKVRMLVDVELDGVKYKPNHVVAFPEALGKTLIDSGQADGSRESVAYCEKELGAKLITHETAATAAARAEVDSLEAELAQLKREKRAESDAGKKAKFDARIEDVKAALAAAEAKLEGGE
jgi:hypothetical protein